MPAIRIMRQGTPGRICGGASVFFFAALYFAISYVKKGAGRGGVRRGDSTGLGLSPESHERRDGQLYARGRIGMRRTAEFTLLSAVWLTSLACGSIGGPGKPDLPVSVSPGWSRIDYNQAPPPAGLPEGPAPECWKANYRGADGTAEVWACGFRAEGSAFNAVQRARAEANTVKFQEGRYLVIVRWSGGSRVDVTALVRAIQKALQMR